MKTKTGLHIVKRMVNGVERIEAYTKEEMNAQYNFNVWWSKAKESLKL